MFGYPKRAIQRKHKPSGAKRSHREYRACLRQEFDFTCVFCRLREQWRAEGAPHGGFQIDHFKPVAKFPNDKLRYTNLTWTCPECNRAKSDTWPARSRASSGQRWLNPTRDRMAEHLEFDGEQVKALSNVGVWNLRRLDLNNALHIRQRQLVGEKTDRLRILRLALQKCTDQHSRSALEDALDQFEHELLSVPYDAPSSCRCSAPPTTTPTPGRPPPKQSSPESPMRNKEAREVVEKLRDYYSGKGRKGKRGGKK